jgi:hypothetical protein
VASVSLRVGRPMSIGSGRGVEEEWPVELLVLRRVEEWRLFFFFLKERLLVRSGEQPMGGSREWLFCRLVGRLSGRSGERLFDRLAGQSADCWEERLADRWGEWSVGGSAGRLAGRPGERSLDRSGEQLPVLSGVQLADRS